MKPCLICGQEGSVEYPLLDNQPTFCSKHHTPKYAEPYGADFSGPDDFDWPDWGEEEE